MWQAARGRRDCAWTGGCAAGYASQKRVTQTTHTQRDSHENEITAPRAWASSQECGNALDVKVAENPAVTGLCPRRVRGALGHPFPMASVLPRPLSWVAPPHVRLPGPRRDLCPSPRDRTRPSVSWAGSRSFRVPTSPRHPGLRPRQRRPPPAKGRGSCPRLDAWSCRASGLSPRREPSPLPRSQRRALTVTFPTGSSTHPQASPGPGSPTSPGGTRGAPRATALWDRRWLPGNPGPPSHFKHP